MMSPVDVRFPPCSTLAMPKSITFTWPDGSIMMLAGLMSRWTTPLTWAWSSAAATWPSDVERLAQPQASALLEQRLQVPAFHELHDDETGPGRRDDVVGGDDVRVSESGRHLRLAKEPGFHLLELAGSAEGLEPDALDGDLPSEHAVTRAKDLPERALSEAGDRRVAIAQQLGERGRIGRLAHDLVEGEERGSPGSSSGPSGVDRSPGPDNQRSSALHHLIVPPCRFKPPSRPRALLSSA